MNYLLGSLVALLLVFTANVGQYLNNQKSFGSTSIGGEYHATSTKNYDGASLTNLTRLQNGSGTLGSVVITGAAAGTIYLWDATTTASHSDYSSTTALIATFPNSAAAGTYTFDVSFQRGLIVELLGTVPTSTITYR